MHFLGQILGQGQISTKKYFFTTINTCYSVYLTGYHEQFKKTIWQAGKSLEQLLASCHVAFSSHMWSVNPSQPWWMDVPQDCLNCYAKVQLWM